MAKGQKKSNKEIKKPKKDKSAAVAPQSSLTARLTESQDRAKNQKK